MHELNIVIHTAKTVAGFAKEQGLTEIDSVTLEIGEVSGIIHKDFVDFWNYMKRGYPVIAKSELVLKITEAITYCGNCRKTYRTVDHGKTCPHCGSGETWLLTGNECVIKEVTVPD